MRPSFNFAEVPVRNVETDTIWQPTLQRQLGVTMCGGSYLVINLFKQNVVSQKKSFWYHDTTQHPFFIDSLTIFTTQMVDFETYSRIILLLVVIAQQ